MNLRILAPCEIDELVAGEVAALLRDVFAKKKQDWERKVNWLYISNPRGKPWCVSARDASGRLVAHSAMVPSSPLDDDRYKHLPVWFSLNTAVRAGLDRPGLMILMLRALVQAVKESGPCVLLGCANANSTIGFTKLLKYRLLGPLQLRVLPPWCVPDSTVPRALKLDDQSLAWRARQTGATLRIGPRSGVLIRRISHFGMPVDAILTVGLPRSAVDALSGLEAFNDSIGIVPVPRLYGVFGGGDGGGISVPSMLRPSPLNYIFRLSSQNLDEDELETFLRSRRFEFVDFDVV
jgi:hypothetical protein